MITAKAQRAQRKDKKTGILINLNVAVLEDGIKRIVNKLLNLCVLCVFAVKLN